MIIEIILALIFGIFFGCISGLIPGIHVNTIAIFLLSFSAFFLLYFSPLALVVFVVSLAITHTTLDYIPSVFLGAPDEDSILGVLPGHKMLLQGKAFQAVVLTLFGSLTALVIILIFTPIFVFLLPIIYPYIQNIMWIILILVSLVLVLSDKKKLWALMIFLLAGFLGIAVLNFNIREPLLPLLTGLFGASSLFLSFFQKTKIPKQKTFKLKQCLLSKKSFARASLASIIASPFTAFLPGLGASQAAVIGKEVLASDNNKEFLFVLGAINTIVMGLSFIALYSIQRTRTGAAVAISKLLPEFSASNLALILTIIIIAGLLSFFIAIFTARFAAKRIHKVKYSKLSLIILIILLIIVLIFTDFSIIGGFYGLLIFIISASLGIFTILLGVRRMHLMGCLLLPTILIYLL
jgi:putative membrane protein